MEMGSRVGIAEKVRRACWSGEGGDRACTCSLEEESQCKLERTQGLTNVYAPDCPASPSGADSGEAGREYP